MMMRAGPLATDRLLLGLPVPGFALGINVEEAIGYLLSSSHSTAA